MGKPRLPWKRGPAAWHVKCRSEEILAQIAACTRRFMTLRGAARLLGLSTQPLRDWIAHGYLCRTGPRLRLSLQELRRFVQWLANRAKPFDASNYLDRFRDRHGALPYSFKKLATAKIVWPKCRTALIPSELAALVGCHPSLVLNAIQAGIQWVQERTGKPSPWQDVPGTGHGGACRLAFADGHSEIKMWKDPRTTSGPMLTSYTTVLPSDRRTNSAPTSSGCRSRTGGKGPKHPQAPYSPLRAPGFSGSGNGAKHVRPDEAAPTRRNAVGVV